MSSRPPHPIDFGTRRDASAPSGLLDRPVESTAAYELVVDRLRRAIHLGEYAPGDRLPSERELSERLTVSRVTLREAIRVLEGEGYLRTTRGAKGGARVVASTMTQEEIRAALRSRVDELEALLDLRVANESLAARRAAQLRTPEEVGELHASVEGIESATDHASFRREDSRFHALVARMSRLPLLAWTVEEARVAMFVSLDALDFDLLLPTTLRGHGAVLRAIEAGDERAAARAMSRHIEATRRDLRRALA